MRSLQDEIVVVEIVTRGAIRSEGAVRGRFPLTQRAEAQALAAKLADLTQREHAILVLTGGAGSVYLHLYDAFENLLDRREHPSLPVLSMDNSNLNVSRRFGRMWVLQTALNLKSICRHPGVGALHGSFASGSVPAVIVSAGPSLDKNIHELAHFQNKAVIVCASQTLKALQKAGIKPHFTVTADADKSVTMQHFEGVDLSSTSLVLSAAAAPSLYTLAERCRAIFTYTSNSIADEWAYAVLEDRPPLLAGGGSVACVAFTLVGNWGCNPIILVGQDLSFPDGKHYAKAVRDLKIEINENEEFKFVVPEDHIHHKHSWGVQYLDSYHDENVKVPTSSVMADFHKWFETMPEMMNVEQEGIRLLNCTEGGARIKGFEQMPLSAVELGEDVDVEYAISSIPDVDPSARWERVQGFVQELIRRMERCRELAASLDADDPKESFDPLVDLLQQIPMLSVAFQDQIGDALKDEDAKRGLVNLLALAEDSVELLLPVLKGVLNER